MPMTPTEIKEALAENGWTMSGIGRRVRPTVSPTQVWRVVHGRDPSPRLRRAIARAINRDVADVFPDDERATEHEAKALVANG